MPIPQFSPDVNWGAFGREYRTGMFLGTVFEYLAQGFVLALMSRYYSLVKQRKASITEQVAVAAAGAMGVAQMCIHTQANYKNGISNYMLVQLLALEEDWQMRSIWATSSVAWTIGAAVFLWDRKQRLQASTRQGACALPAFILSSALMAATAASGVAIAIMRSTFAANAIATVTGEISMPEGFNTVKRVLYIHYGLIVASQLVLSVIAFQYKQEMAKTESHQRGTVAKVVYLYYRQLMIAPLAFASAVLLCFVIRPGKNIELIVYLPFSAVSFGNVVSLLNQDALDASSGTNSACSSRTDDMQKFRHSVINPRVLIPLERSEVIAISDKDANYTPSRIGINRLPYSQSTSTVSHSGYEKSKENSLKRQNFGSIF